MDIIIVKTRKGYDLRLKRTFLGIPYRVTLDTLPSLYSANVIRRQYLSGNLVM